MAAVYLGHAPTQRQIERRESGFAAQPLTPADETDLHFLELLLAAQVRNEARGRPRRADYYAQQANKLRSQLKREAASE